MYWYIRRNKSIRNWKSCFEQLKDTVWGLCSVDKEIVKKFFRDFGREISLVEMVEGETKALYDVIWQYERLQVAWECERAQSVSLRALSPAIAKFMNVDTRSVSAK